MSTFLARMDLLVGLNGLLGRTVQQLSLKTDSIRYFHALIGVERSR